MMEIIDLSAATAAPGSDGLRELYKSVKYLLNEDVANYRCVHGVACI